MDGCAGCVQSIGVQMGVKRSTDLEGGNEFMNPLDLE